MHTRHVVSPVARGCLSFSLFVLPSLSRCPSLSLVLTRRAILLRRIERSSARRLACSREAHATETRERLFSAEYLDGGLDPRVKNTTRAGTAARDDVPIHARACPREQQVERNGIFFFYENARVSPPPSLASSSALAVTELGIIGNP